MTRTLVPALMLLLAVAGCDNRHPLSDKERRDDYGDLRYAQNAPFNCIYVGLDTNEAALFATNFWRFALQHGIHKPKKHYTTYSGPGVFTGISEHVAVMEGVNESAYLVDFHERFPPITLEEASMQQAAAGWAIYSEHFWPTNASRIIKEGHETLAPFTGEIKLVADDTNYPLRDFKQLSEALTATLQSAFPDRAIRVVSYDGGKP